MKNKILVIEDDRAISELLCMNLEAAGYETVAAYDGEEAQRLLLWQEDADLAVVDIMLPGKDGFALMEDFKKKELPVLYLTAKDDVASKVKGLKLGAEDYMVKPFEMLELLVRIEKVLERTGRAKKVLTVRNILVDMQSHQVYKDGLPVSLKPMEYDLFYRVFGYPAPCKAERRTERPGTGTYQQGGKTPGGSFWEDAADAGALSEPCHTDGNDHGR